MEEERAERLLREAEQEFDGLEETESEGNDDVVPNIDLS